MFEMTDSLHTANFSCCPIPISTLPETSTGLSKRSEDKQYPKQNL